MMNRYKGVLTALIMEWFVALTCKYTCICMYTNILPSEMCIMYMKEVLKPCINFLLFFLNVPRQIKFIFKTKSTFIVSLMAHPLSFYILFFSFFIHLCKIFLFLFIYKDFSRKNCIFLMKCGYMYIYMQLSSFLLFILFIVSNE